MHMVMLASMHKLMVLLMTMVVLVLWVWICLLRVTGLFNRHP